MGDWAVTRSLQRAMIGGVTSFFIAAASPTSLAQSSDPLYPLQISDVDLADALEQLSIATGAAVLMFLEDVEGVAAPDLVGEFTLEDALKRLTADTGLDVSQLENGAHVVFRRKTPMSPEPKTNHAAASPPTADEEALRYLEPISVSGFRAALDRAGIAESNSNQLIDVMSSEDIGQFPEQNVSEALQRLPGVQITRQNGEGAEINIRGLPSEFTRVEIDGRSTIVNVEESNPQRIGELSVFASDLFSQISVVKTPTAADIEGAVAGIVRLETPDPLDLKKNVLSAKVRLRTSDYRGSTEPYVSAVSATRSDDRSLGLLLSGTYEERDRTLDKFQNNVGWRNELEADDGALTSIIFPSRFRQEIRAGDAVRSNLSAKLQYRPYQDTEFSIDAHYSDEARSEDRSRLQVNYASGSLIETSGERPDGALSTALFQDATTDLVQFHRDTDIEVIGLTGGAEWSIGRLSTSGEFVWSRSKETLEETQAAHRSLAPNTAGYSLAHDARLPIISTSVVEQSLQALDIRRVQSELRKITVEESSARFDGRYRLLEGDHYELQFGLRLARADFDRRQGFLQYDVTGLSYADGAPFLSGRQFADGFGGADVLRHWPSIDPVALMATLPDPGGFSFDDPNFYAIEETVTSGYGQLSFDSASHGGLSIRGNTGFRVVHTDYAGKGRVRVIDELGIVTGLFDNAPQLDADYTDVLPSINVRLSHLNLGGLELRAAVSRAIARPEIQRIRPTITFNLAENRIRRGAPELEPYRAWQADASIRYGFGEDLKSALSIDVFLKDIESFILPTTRMVEAATFPEFGIEAFSAEISTFENSGDALVQGVELEFETPFSVLTAPFSNLGVVTNYTYTDSTFRKPDSVRSALPGASEHAFNAIGYYETDRFSARLSYVYRDKFVVELGDENGQDTIITDAQGRLDFALRYQLLEGLSVMLDGQNITGEQNYIYYDTPARLEDHELEGALYSLSLLYTF